MNCDRNNASEAAPIHMLLVTEMPKPLIHRHSADSLDAVARESRSRVTSRVNGKTYPMVDSSQGELSLSDLGSTRPRRQRRGFASKMMEDTSSKTALTVNESYNHSSSFGCSFSQSKSSTARGSSRNFGLPRGTSDASNASQYSSCRRCCGDASVNEDGSMTDSSLCSISSALSSSSRIRCLKGIRRRRSAPATRRWREQCSRLYKEHILDADPEQQAALAVSIAAATKIQLCVRRFLLQTTEAKRDIWSLSCSTIFGVFFLLISSRDSPPVETTTCFHQAWFKSLNNFRGTLSTSSSSLYPIDDINICDDSIGECSWLDSWTCPSLFRFST